MRPDAVKGANRTMERRPFGTTAREVAVIGQGAWYIDEADAKTATAVLRRGLDLGMNHLDTARAQPREDGAVIAGRPPNAIL
jgi:diketogulonate reductase-like aldo/keto reductase